MRYGDFLSSLSLASSHSGGFHVSLFSPAHGSGGHVRVNRLKTCAPIYASTEHAQFVDVSKFEFMVATFYEGLWT